MAKYYHLQQKETVTCLSHFYQLHNMRIMSFRQENDILNYSEENRFQKLYEENSNNIKDLTKAVSRKDQYLDDQIEKNSMNQHVFILKKYIRKYYKLFSSSAFNKSINSQQLQNQLIIANQEKKQENIDGKQITGKLLETIFENYEKIKLYVNFIENEYSANLSLSIKNIILLVLGEQKNNTMGIMDEQTIIYFTNKLVDQQFICKVGTILNGNTFKQQNITSQMKMFTIFLVNSILFIAAEYYVNPYYQLQQKLIVREFRDHQILLYDCLLLDRQNDQKVNIQNISGRKLRKI